MQGALDSNLTPLGIEQGKRLGLLLKMLVPAHTRIICSPQGRARHTARLIRESGGFASEAVTDARLAEVSLGDWDGMLRDDIEEIRPGFNGGDRRWDWFFTAPNGDRYETLETRLGDWLREAAAFSEPLIVVSHGVAGRILRGVYAGMSRDATLKQDVPQDAVFHLSGGAVRRIDCL